MQRRLLPATLLLAAAALLAACGGGDGDAFAETVKLKVNQSKSVDGGRLTLTMTKFIDSRCPRNVTCVTAGSAVVDLTLAEQGRASANVQVTLGGTGTSNTAAYGQYTVEITDLQPLPEGPVLVITDSEATLVVRR